MAGRFLNLFKPIARFIPEIKKPERRIRFNEKLFWMAIALILYLVMSEVPLYGIQRTAMGELAALRVIFASQRGTLMELGIGPIVTSGLILQLLVGSEMIDADMSRPADRSLFTTASKVFAIILTGVQAIAYMIGGMYGTLSGPIAVIVFLQLIAAGFVVLLLDEMLQKGWGFGSGISLFILAGVAQQIFWQSFSPSTGLFVGGLSTVLGGNEPITSWIFGRGAYPSLIGFIATVAAFLVVMYLQGVKIELPMSYAGYKGFRSRYPIKLLYVSVLPVIFASALFANIYFFSQILWSMNGQPTPGEAPFWLNLLGQFNWVAPEGGGEGNLQPIGGLVYYVISPQNFASVLGDPLKAIIYLSLLVGFCIVFSLTWLEVGGLDSETVAQQLVDSGMQIPGYRRSGRAIEPLLRRYIPVVAILSGIIVGLLAGISDIFGVFGSGTGILLSVGIIYQLYETLMRERAAEMFPAFRKILGE